jgi:hypothetical protein
MQRIAMMLRNWLEEKGMHGLINCQGRTYLVMVSHQPLPPGLREWELSTRTCSRDWATKSGE